VRGIAADVFINRCGRGSGIFGGRQSDKKRKDEILFLQTTGGGWVDLKRN